VLTGCGRSRDPRLRGLRTAGVSVPGVGTGHDVTGAAEPMEESTPVLARCDELVMHLRHVLGYPVDPRKDAALGHDPPVPRIQRN
jgi:hypothetical protein